MASRPRLVVQALVAAAALGLAGCATAPAEPPPQPAPLFEDAAFGAPAHPPEPAAVFALSPAMRDYLAKDIASLLREQGPQRGLVDALRSRARLKLEYDAEYTRTAAQAFEHQSGNCLSLAVMTAALARHLGLPVTYQVLVGHETWSRSGDLSFVNGHVSILVARRAGERFGAFDPDLHLRIDFASLPVGRRQALRTVDESTIVSMFMNNRAAEYLVRGQIDDAYAHAREAVLQDATYAGAYNTLGVIFQRRGLTAAAERAYRATLALDDNHRSALLNLAQLLEHSGREAEAASLQARLASLERDPPFAHFDRGVAAARAGQFALARDEIQREMKRDPDYHEFHFWLAVALYGLGDVPQARQHLDTAMKNSLTTRDQAIYASKLRGLNARLPATRLVQ